MSTLQLRRVEDPREPLELLHWRELLVLAEFLGHDDVKYGMPEELMRDILRSKNLPSFPVPKGRQIPGATSRRFAIDTKGYRRMLERYRDGHNAVRDGMRDTFMQDAPEPEPEATVSTLELARQQYAQRDAAQIEGKRIDDLNFHALRRECAARKIKYVRTDKMKDLRERLYPDGYPA